MRSFELATAPGASIAGIELVHAVTVLATAFLALTMAFFVVVSLQPHFTGSAMTERKKSILVGLGAAAAGAIWMVAVLSMAEAF